MSNNYCKKLVELITKRENLMEDHFKGISALEAFNYPEHRFWYTENIAPIDEKIVNTANSLIVKLSMPCKKQKSIHDVYNNKWLEYYIKESKQSKESNTTDLEK